MRSNFYVPGIYGIQAIAYGSQYITKNVNVSGMPVIHGTDFYLGFYIVIDTDIVIDSL